MYMANQSKFQGWKCYGCSMDSRGLWGRWGVSYGVLPSAAAAAWRVPSGAWLGLRRAVDTNCISRGPGCFKEFDRLFSSTHLTQSTRPTMAEVPIGMPRPAFCPDSPMR